jgi:hypothetical protein
MKEQEIVKKSLTEICRTLGYATETMTQRNFEHLSQEIEDKTGILISISTIKRLMHGEFLRLPQTATLNAISNYLGYKNWQEYKMSLAFQQDPGERNHSNTFNAETPNPVKLLSIDKTVVKEKSFNFKWIFLIVPFLVLLAFIKIKSRPVFNADRATFTVHRTTSHDIPNTVVFNFDIDQVVADSFFIQQSWDKNRRVRISKGMHTLTDIYYEPGYHIAKLIANDSIIRKIEISLPADRWFFYAYDLKPGSPQVEIKTATPVQHGCLGFDSIDLKRNKIDIDAEPIYFQTYFPAKMDIPADSFLYKTRIRMHEFKPLQCPFVICEVLGQYGSYYFKATNKGCAHRSMVQLGTTTRIMGNTTDLSGLCTNPFDWNDYEIVAKNNQLIIYNNGDEVFRCELKKSIGLLTGLAFLSNGRTEVSQVSLKSPDGKIFYESDFEQGK